MLSTKRSTCSLTVVLGLLLAPLAGCNTGPRGTVQGKVSIDGEKIQHGGIVFVLLDESESERVTGKIIDGRYYLDSHHGPRPGPHRVEIYWQKKTGNKVPGEGGNPRDEIVAAIPPRYNTESELKADVRAGSNTFDFVLNK